MSPPSTSRTLYRGGRIYSPADPHATALLVEGDRIGWLGPDDDAPAADTTVDLAGALVTPAFVDAHVHATDTGIALLGLDLSGARSAPDVLDAVAAKARDLPADAVVLGHGWEEAAGRSAGHPPPPNWTRPAAAGRCICPRRRSIRPSARRRCSRPPRTWPAARVRPGRLGAAGSPSRRTRGRASGRSPSRSARTPNARCCAGRRRLGIAAVHECGGPGTSDEADFTGLLALAGALPEVYGYWGELGGAARARELGAVGAGGDLYADGALGSRTRLPVRAVHRRPASAATRT